MHFYTLISTRRGIDAASNRRAVDEYRMQNDYLQQRIRVRIGKFLFKIYYRLYDFK